MSSGLSSLPHMTQDEVSAGSIELPSFRDIDKFCHYDPRQAAHSAMKRKSYGLIESSLSVHNSAPTDYCTSDSYSRSDRQYYQSHSQARIIRPSSRQIRCLDDQSIGVDYPLYGSQSTTVDRRGAASPAPSSSSYSSRSDMVEDPYSSGTQSWEQHAQPYKASQSGPAVFKCLWPASNHDSGETLLRICGYSAKKQLVKRHIETTHFKLKPFECSWCNKSFPQKTSLDIHVSGHTGQRPHACKFGCGATFKDPARRHRHYIDNHGYKPKNFRKKNQGDTTEIWDPSSQSTRPLRYVQS